jgi:hypothetical protein
LQGLDPSFVAACSCTQPFKVSTIAASTPDIVQLIEPMHGAASVHISVATELRPDTGSSALSGFVYWCDFSPSRLRKSLIYCRWQMDFQEGNISYCTRGNIVDGCSFKLAAYRVPSVSFSEGQHLGIHVELIESTVTFRVAVQEGL